MAFKPIEILINAKDNASAAIGGLREKMSALGEAAQSLAGRLAAAFAIGGLASAAAEMETLKSGLLAVSGSADQAARDMDFVGRMANTAGVSVADAGRAFLGLSAATRGTAVEGEATRAVFEAVTVSMAKAGKSSAETSNALQALSQMASKGVVQSEELRGQLGEALPGALNAAAKGFGITTAELMKLVEQGQITAKDLFPALTQGLNDLYGTADGGQTLSQELVNVKNAFVEMANSIGESGGLAALKTGAEIAQAAIVLLGDTLVRTGKTIGVMMAALVNLDFSGLKQSFADIEAEGRDKLLKAAAHNDVLRAALSSTGDAAFQAALAQQQAGAAAAQSGEQAVVARDQWVQLNNGYAQVLQSVRDQIEEQAKSVLAREAEGKASVALAQAFGTEIEQRHAAVSAAEANAAAQKDLAQLRQTEVEAMRSQLSAMLSEGQAHGELSKERAKQIDDLQKQIALRSQDADKATAQAAASHLLAERVKVEIETYKDNSARVAELRDNYEALRANLAKVRAERDAGKATTEAVTKAEIEAGKAALLYRDAVRDQLRAIEAKRDAQQSAISLESATVRLAIEQQRSIYEVAKARGDESAAARAQNEIRRLEIQLLELTAQAKRAEAKAALAVIDAKRAELVASGQLTEAKRLELDAARNAAKAKEVEAQISEVTAQKMRNLASAQSEAARTARDHADASKDSADALDKLSDASERFKSRSTRFVGMLQTDINQAIAQLYGDDMVGNAKAEEAWMRKLELENYEKGYGDVRRSQESLNQERNIRAELARLEQEIERERRGKKSDDSAIPGASSPGGPPGGSSENTSAPARESAPTRTTASGMATGTQVTINLEGRARTVNTDAAGANVLQDLLRELGNGRGTYQ